MALERWILRFRSLVSLALILAVWQGVAMLELVPRKYFPPIPDIAAGFWSMLLSGELLAGDSLTLGRALVGIGGGRRSARVARGSRRRRTDGGRLGALLVGAAGFEARGHFGFQHPLEIVHLFADHRRFGWSRGLRRRGAARRLRFRRHGRRCDRAWLGRRLFAIEATFGAAAPGIGGAYGRARRFLTPGRREGRMGRGVVARVLEGMVVLRVVVVIKAGGGECFGNIVIVGVAFGDDPAFDHHIGRAADHDQMLDIVAPHQHKAAAGIDRGAVEHLQAVLPAAAGAQEGQRAAIANEAQDHHKAGQRYADARDRDEQASSIISDDVFHAIVLQEPTVAAAAIPVKAQFAVTHRKMGRWRGSRRLTADFAVVTAACRAPPPQDDVNLCE